MSGLLSARAVTQQTSLSRVTVWRMVRRGEFPAPVQISKGRIAWPAEEVSAWVSERIQQRDTATAERETGGGR